MSESVKSFVFHSKDFNINASSNWRDIQNQKDFHDVTIACEDGQVDAHKVVLSACSPVLGKLLKKHPHNHPLLVLRGAKYSALVSVLDFMYQGDVSILQQNFNDFLNLMKDLKVSGDFKMNDANFRIEDSVNDQINKDLQYFNMEGDQIKNDKDFQHFNMDEVSQNKDLQYFSMDGDPIKLINKGTDLQYFEIDEVPKNKDTDLQYFNLDGDPIMNAGIVQNFNKVEISTTIDCEENSMDEKSKKLVDENTSLSIVGGIYSCKYCDVKPSTKQSLEKHIERIHERDLNSTDCKICEKSFYKHDIKTHVMTVHTKETRHKCDQCDFGCVVKQNLFRHMRIKHNAMKYLCKICGFETPDRNTIRKHETNVHTDERKFSCDLCGKLFKADTGLKKHIQIIHRDEKFPCETCGKEFACKDYLNSHVKSHNSSLLLYCTFCGKGFVTIQKLKEHTNIHTGDKPFSCPSSKCDKNFSSSSTLVHHKKKCLV